MLAKSSVLFVAAIAPVLLQAATVLSDKEDLVPVLRSNLSLNVTTGTEDYARASRRLYYANLLEFESVLAALQLSFQHQVAVAQKQNVLLLEKLQDIYRTLQPLEVLSLLAKHCVQKYSWQLPQYRTLRNTLESCATRALSYFASDTSAMSSTIRSMYSYYDVTMTDALNNCNKTYPRHQLSYTPCVNKVVTDANDYISKNRINWNKNVRDANCNLESRIDVMLDCSFPNTYNAVSIGSAVMQQVTDCVEDYKNPKPPCGDGNNNNNNATHISPCPYVMEVSFSDVNFLNATIPNPFYGLQSTTKCMQVNFLPNLISERAQINL